RTGASDIIAAGPGATRPSADIRVREVPIMAPRSVKAPASAGSHSTVRSACTMLGAALIALAAAALAATEPAPSPPAGAEPAPLPPSQFALDRIRAGGKLVIGYRADAAPMSTRDASGHPIGYSIAVCRKVADALKAELGLASLDVQWVVASPGY